MIEEGDGIPEQAARQLQVIACAMGGGLVMMAGLVAWSYVNAEAKIPAPNDIRMINLLTTVSMAVAVVSIVASEFVWRAILRKATGALGGRVMTAYIVRLAMREGAGLLGMTVAYLAAVNGVLRAYPAYWVNLAPFALFLGFLAAHFPSTGKLTEEAREALGAAFALPGK